MDRQPSSHFRGGKRTAVSREGSELPNHGFKRSRTSLSTSQGDVPPQPVNLTPPNGSRQILNTFLCEPGKFNLTSYLTRQEFLEEFKRENAFQRDLSDDENQEIYSYLGDYEDGEPCPALLSPEKERRMRYFERIKDGLGIPNGFVPEIEFWSDNGRSTKYDISFIIHDRSLVSDFRSNMNNNENVVGITVINYGDNKDKDKKEIRIDSELIWNGQISLHPHNSGRLCTSENCLGWNTLEDHEDEGYLPVTQQEGITVERGGPDPEILIRDKIIKWKCDSNLTNVHPMDYLSNDLNDPESINEHSKYSSHLKELSGKLKSFKYNSSVYNYRPWLNPDLPLKSFTQEYGTDYTREEDHGWAFNVNFDDLIDNASGTDNENDINLVRKQEIP